MYFELKTPKQKKTTKNKKIMKPPNKQKEKKKPKPKPQSHKLI